MKKEEWKKIDGYDGKYLVSNYGRVKSRRGVVVYKAGGKHLWSEKILKNVKKSIGYVQVSLHDKNGYKLFLVHRLVAKCFIPNPKNKPQVNHKDGNGFNNRVKNLEWSTASENGLHSYRVLGNVTWSKGRFGKDNHRSKKIIQKTPLGDIVTTWDSMMDAQRAGYDSGCICRCCQGQSKTHNGFIWTYEKSL